MAHFIEELWVG